MMKRQRQRIGRRLVVLLATAVVACGAAGAVALARSLAAPANTSPPTISGTAKEGSTLTARDGTWSNSPTSFAYQWRRCATDGTACGDISGATKETYTLVTGDVSRTIRVEVTATNADGKGTATSEPTDVVDSKNGPTNSVRPAVSGSAQVGEELAVSNGTWSPMPTSFGRQWQRCDSAAEDCRNISGATGRTYCVRSADVGHRLRELVTARTSEGVATTASSASGVVAGQTTVTTSTTVQGNRPPSITFLSLKWVGRRVYVRFRVCDDRPGRLTIIERDNKARALAATRRFSVLRVSSCGSFTRNWIPAKRFRTRGRLVVTLRAVDSSHALSRLVSRSIRHR
jgi:hypothetical protein